MAKITDTTREITDCKACKGTGVLLENSEGRYFCSCDAGEKEKDYQSKAVA